MADFVWRVSRSGYKWTMIDREGTPRYDTLATDQSAEFREYRPMDVEGLFLRFADLDEKDPEAWLAFANEYGHLTAGVCVTDQDDQECECDLADRLRWPNGDDLPFGPWTEVALPPGYETQTVWWGHILAVRNQCRAWRRSKADPDR